MIGESVPIAGVRSKVYPLFYSVKNRPALTASTVRYCASERETEMTYVRSIAKEKLIRSSVL